MVLLRLAGLGCAASPKVAGQAEQEPSNLLTKEEGKTILEIGIADYLESANAVYDKIWSRLRFCAEFVVSVST